MNDRLTSIQVLEEDSWQVLSTQATVIQNEHHPIRVMTDMLDQKPLHPGDVLTRGKQWIAIVYDLDKNPICRPEWISASLTRILALSETHHVRSIMLPIPGHKHGDMPWETGLELLVDALNHHKGSCLEEVWVKVDDKLVRNVQKQLANSDKSA